MRKLDYIRKQFKKVKTIYNVDVTPFKREGDLDVFCIPLSNGENENIGICIHHAIIDPEKEYEYIYYTESYIVTPPDRLKKDNPWWR